MKSFIKKFKPIIIFFLLHSIFTVAQEDSVIVSKTPMNIGDSTSVSDSLTQIKRKNIFQSNFKDFITETKLSSYNLIKHELDYLDYKYSGDIVLHLPFASMNNFGYSGAPNEPNIFSNGYGNVTLSINSNSFNNVWNNSIDLNRIQTEDISTIEIIPITRSFLYGTYNNSSVINVITLDTLRSKPLSRIRYYQAPNDEGFIDAMFSARVLSRLVLGFRLTNISSTGELKNTNYGSWKANIKGVYKISDSLYGKVNYYYLKSEVGLNGGININSSSSPSTVDIYNQFAPVSFSDRYNKTTIYNVDASLYGYLFANNFFRIVFGQYYNSDKFNQNKSKEISDSTRITNENKYNLTFAKFTTEQNLGRLKLKLSTGYEFIQYNIEAIEYNKDQQNYYAWLFAQYDFLNNSIRPSVFSKLSRYNSQSNNGLGADIRFNFFNTFQFFIGYSNFEKPYSIAESETLPQVYLDKVQSFQNFFTTIEYKTIFFNASLSYFTSQSYNTPIPVFNNRDLTLSSTKIIFSKSENISNDGMNFSADIKLWRLAANINFNYYNLIKNSSSQSSSNYNFITGLYYIDTLYNSNLYLKTGFTFYLNSNTDLMYYDFQQLRSSGYYLENGNATPFSTYNISNNPYRLDFFLSGRIQKLATFFFVYENILGNDYFIVPYYPITSGGIRLGISWDFIN